MESRIRYRSVVAWATTASILLGAIGLAAASAPPRPAATEQLQVTVGTAFAFTLSSDEVTPSATVTLTVTQLDDVAHTFTLSSVAGFTFPAGASATDIATFFTAHPPLVNVTIPMGQGQSMTTFVAPPFGLYEYICTVGGHFQAGMWGILGSGEHGSSGSVSTGPGAPVFIIGGTISGLVVAALVLGFVVGRRRGSHDEMPPERLGYPESSTGPRPPPY
jgi:plastocyanin